MGDDLGLQETVLGMKVGQGSEGLDEVRQSISLVEVGRNSGCCPREEQGDAEQLGKSFDGHDWLRRRRAMGGNL